MKSGPGSPGANPYVRPTSAGPPGFIPAAVMISASQFAWTSMIPLLPSLSTSLGADTAQVGAVIAAFGVGRLMVNIPAGIVAGRGRGMAMLALGAVTVSVAAATTAFVESVALLMIIRVAMGLAAGLALTCGLAIVGQLTDAGTRGRMISRLQLIQLVATTSGPVTGGVLTSKLGTQSALLISGAIGASLSIVAYRAARSTPIPHPSPVVAQTPDRTPPVRKRSAGTRRLLVVSGVGFAVFLARFGGEHTLVPLMGTGMGLTVSELGLLLSMMSVFQALGVVVNSRIYDRFPKKSVVVVSCGLLAMALLGVGVASALTVFIIMAMLMGIAQGLTVPASSAFLIDATPAPQLGVAVGVYRTFGDLAAVIGPLGVGLLITAGGDRLATVMLTCCIVAILLVFARLAVEPEHLPDPDHREERA
jgi:MFS family permease